MTSLIAVFHMLRNCAHSADDVEAAPLEHAPTTGDISSMRVLIVAARMCSVTVAAI